jgi:hypothetical protein
MNDTIKSIISQVVKLNEKNEAIKKLNGENFNIFSILDMERNEVETHSKFIFELLNPNGSHAQGDLFLKLFMKNVLNLSTDDMVNAEVKREDITGFIARDKRIDFTIKTSKYQIGIEMKIDADDQDEQLKDYHIELNSRKNSTQEVKLFYLTLTGYEAQPYSSKDLEVDNDYFLISFESEILHWIERCIEKSATIPTLREGLVHYRNLVRKITNTLPIQMEQDMEDIIRDSKDIQAMQTIVNEYPTIWAKKEKQFWDTLWQKLEKDSKGLNFILEDDNEIFYDSDGVRYDEKDIIDDIQERRNKKYYLIGFLLKKLYGELVLKLYIIEWNGKISFYLDFSVDSNFDEKVMNNKLNTICQEIGFSNKDKKQRYKYAEQKITFYGRYQQNPTYELFDDSLFNSYVESIYKEIVDILEYLKIKENEILKAY